MSSQTTFKTTRLSGSMSPSLSICVVSPQAGEVEKGLSQSEEPRQLLRRSFKPLDPLSSHSRHPQHQHHHNHRPLRHVHSQQRLASESSSSQSKNPLQYNSLSTQANGGISYEAQQANAEHIEFISSKSSIRFILEEGKKTTNAGTTTGKESPLKSKKPRQTSLRMRYSEDQQITNSFDGGNRNQVNNSNNNINYPSNLYANQRLATSVIDLLKPESNVNSSNYLLSPHSAALTSSSLPRSIQQQQQQQQQQQHHQSQSSRDFLSPVWGSNNNNNNTINNKKLIATGIPIPSLFKSSIIDLHASQSANNKNFNNSSESQQQQQQQQHLAPNASQFGFKQQQGHHIQQQSQSVSTNLQKHQTHMAIQTPMMHENSHFFSQNWNGGGISETKRNIRKQIQQNSNIQFGTQSQQSAVSTCTLYQQYMKRLKDNNQPSPSALQVATSSTAVPSAGVNVSAVIPSTSTPNSSHNGSVQQSDKPQLNSYRKNPNSLSRIPLSMQNTPASRRFDGSQQQYQNQQLHVFPMNMTSIQFTTTSNKSHEDHPAGVTASAFTHANPISQLRFPASQKALQEFNRAQEQNELRFARREKGDFHEDHRQESFSPSTLSQQQQQQKNHQQSFQNQSAQPIGTSSSSSSVNASHTKGNNSLRIMELVRERNHVQEYQRQLQVKNSIDQEKQRNEQFETLVSESISSQPHNHSVSFSSQQNLRSQQNSTTAAAAANATSRKGKQITQLQSQSHLLPHSSSSLIVIHDVSEITKSRHHISIAALPPPPPPLTSEYDFLHNKLTNNHLSKLRPQNMDNILNPYLSAQQTMVQHSSQGDVVNFGGTSFGTLHMTQIPESTSGSIQNVGMKQRFKTQGSIQVQDTEIASVKQFIIQKEVAGMEEELQRETRLVDELQQTKIEVREALNTYLNSRPKLLKLIVRNCLMDQEQLVFFLMNFMQFCIDDMFSSFKISYKHRISSILEGNLHQQQQQQLNSQAQQQPSSRRIPISITTSQKDSESGNLEFKFTQKIPEEIIHELTDVMKESLSKSQRITSQLTNQTQLIRFFENVEKNVAKYILPQTIIDRMGGFVRLRQLISGSLKTLNNYINSASKLNHVEESDELLVDKHLMPTVCALLNDDIDTLRMQISIFKAHKNVMSWYDFFTIKKLAWDVMAAIKLDPKLKFQVILSIENLRYEIFENPFQARLKALGSSMMKSYEVCNYFRNPSAAENQSFLAGLMKVLYQNGSYSEFIAQTTPKLKFTLNDRFFDFLQKFLLEELKETDSKSLIDVQIRITKLRIKAGLSFNFFTIVENEDSESFFTAILPFLQQWMQKYNLSNTAMDGKAQDFKFLELFVKWALNKQDLFSVMDSEPSLLHYVVNEFTLSFWIKGIVAFLEQRGIPKNKYKHLVQFISLYLLFKKDPNQSEKSEEPPSVGVSPIKERPAI